MDPTQAVVALLSVTGVAAILLAITNAIIRQVTGRAGREREHNTTVETQRVRAIEERDAAYRNQQKAMDEVARLRTVVVELGGDPGPRIVYEPTIKSRASRPRRTKE